MENKDKVAIVGSGIIGCSWAVLFSKAGYSVCLYDTVEEQLSKALTLINNQLKMLERKGLLTGVCKSPDEAFKEISTSQSLEDAVKGAVFIQENVPENLEIKKKIFSDIDNLIGENTIMSSSSSCIYPSAFATGLKHESQCLVSHPVNPPFLVPLVEVVPSPKTSKETVEKTMKIMTNIGQHPVLLKKEIDGFLLNRIQYAILMESWRLVQDGICEPEDIDAVMSHGLGLRYCHFGPFQTIHMNAPKGVVDYCERYGKKIERISKDQCSSRSFNGETAKKIHDAMSKQMPVESLAQSMELRNEKLADLVLHKSKNV